MRKNQVEKFPLKSFIFLGLIFLVFTCQKDDTSNDTEKSITIQEPKITTIENFGLTDSRFNSLKEALNLDVYLKSKSALAQSRTTQDTLGLTIATDIIKQVTLGDYTSYTMEVVQETDSTVFYNLTIEYKNGETGMFLTKYTPTQYWLDNTNESYQGEIETARINELTEYTDVDQMFDEDLVGGDNNTGLGSGVGGSNDNYTPQGSPYYPTDCGGTVIITMESIPYPCGCGDWPGGNCQGCNNSSPMFPGYTQVPYYTCIDYGYGNPVDGNTNTTSGGQTLEGDDPAEDEGSIAAMIKPEECTAQFQGDLDNNCIIDAYETYMMIKQCLNQNNTTLTQAQIDFLQSNFTQATTINNYLQNNNCSDEAQEDIIITLQILENEECVFLPLSQDLSNIEASYTGELGDEDNSVQLDHESVKIQYQTLLDSGNKLAAVQYLINTYSMSYFSDLNVIGDFSIIFNQEATPEAVTNSYFTTTGYFLNSEIIINDGLLDYENFPWITRSIKHELFHVFQAKYYPYGVTTNAEREFEAYWYSIYRFSKLPKTLNLEDMIRLARRVKINYDLLTDSQKSIPEISSKWNKFKNDFKEICNEN